MWWAYIRGGGAYIRGGGLYSGGLIVGGLRYVLTLCLVANTSKAGFPLQAYRTETYQKRF
jgi:hypothetical protein